MREGQLDRNGLINHVIDFSRPNTGLSTLDEEKTDLLHRYTPVDRDTAGRL